MSSGTTTSDLSETGNGKASLWAWVALGAAIAALATMFVLPESPVFSISLAILGLVTAWLAKGAASLRAVVILAAVLAFLALAVHLTVGLAWSSTAVGV